MKIFVAGPEEPDSFIHNIAHTFRAMGNDVVTMPMPSESPMRSSFTRELAGIYQRLSKRVRLKQELKAIQIAKKFKPVLTLVGTRTLEPETIHEIRRATRSPVVCWFGDSVANLKREHITSGEYDLVFLKDPGFAMKCKAMLGIDAYHLDEACNPDWHRPASDRGNDSVLLAGSLYGYRCAVARQLVDAGVQLSMYGSRPPKWVQTDLRRYHTGLFLNHTNKALVFGESLACLNTFSPAEMPESLNCRIFETCGSGALLLSESRGSISRCFDPGVEYIEYDNIGECLEQIEKLLSDYRAAEKIRNNAWRRAHSDHSYRKRLEYILDKVELNSPK